MNKKLFLISFFLIIVLSLNALAAYTSTANLHFTMNSTTSPYFNDGSESANVNLTNIGGTLGGVGKLNNSYSWTGASQMANGSIPSSLRWNETTNFSFMMWYKKDANPTPGGYEFARVGAANFGIPRYGFNQELNGNVSFEFVIGGSSFNTAIINLANNQYYWLYGEQSGGIIRFYVNDTLILTTQHNKTDVLSSATLEVGSFWASVAPGASYADDIRLYNRTLASDERAYIYNNGVGTENITYINGTGNVVNTTINISTYDFTSAINAGNQTIWRTNQSYPAQTYDDTPTVKFNLTTASTCAIGIDNVNYTAMLARSNATVCAEIGSITQTCTINNSLSFGSTNIFLSCEQTQNKSNSHSGALVVSLITPPDLIFINSSLANNSKMFWNNVNITISSNNTNPNNYNQTIIRVFNSTGSVVVSNFSTSNIATLFNNNLSIGVYFFNATSYNTTGAVLNITETRTFTIYNLTINITTPQNNDVIYTTSIIRVNVTSTNVNWNYTRISIYQSNGSLIASMTNITSQNFSLPYTTISDDVYTISNSVCDILGNCNSLNNRSVTVNNRISFSFVSNLGSQLITNRFITFNDTTNGRVYNTTNGTIGYNISSTNISYVVTINASYSTYSATLVFTPATDSYTISLAPIVGLTFYDENTLALFNMSSPDSMQIVVYYTNGNSTTLQLDGNSTNPYFLNITQTVSKIRILEYYTTPNVITIYRTYLSTTAFNLTNLNTNIWLLNLRTSDVIFNSFQIFDLMKDYTNPRVLVTKIINSVEETITGDYADLDGKVGAYLLAGAQYNLKLFSDNKPTRVLGSYYADSAGVIYLRLFDVVGVDLTSSTDAMNNKYSTNLVNASGVTMIYSQFNGTYITGVTWTVYNNTLAGSVLSTSTISNISGIFTYVPAAGVTDMIVRMVLTLDCSSSSTACLSPITYDRTFNINHDVSKPTFDKPYTFPWIIFLFILIILLSLNFKTAPIGGALVLGLLMFLGYIGWFVLTAGIIGLITIVILTLLFKRGNDP